MSICGHCDEIFDRRKSPGITCSGMCGKIYQIKCVGIPSDNIQCLKTPGFCWYCPGCYKIRNKYEEYIKGSFDSKLNQMLGGFKDMFNDLLIKISNQAEETFSKICFTPQSTEPSYSNAVKSKSMIVIKPRDTSQTNSRTKRDIMKNIDPVDLNLKVSQVKQVKDGGLFISCEDSEGADNIKKIVREKLSPDYRVSDVKKFLPKVKIVGLDENYPADEIVKFLRGQNNVISNSSHLRVLKTWATNKNSEIFQAIIEMDADTYTMVMKQGKLFVNFDVCSVYDATELMICYNCSGFNHGQSKCSHNTACPRCAGDHCLNSCTSSVRKCINCFNAKLNDFEHAAWDAGKCPIYLKKFNNLKSSLFANK